MRAVPLALVLAAACGGGGGGGDDDGGSPAAWQALGEHRPSSLLSVWSSGLDNIWVVGGREAIGMPPTVLHYNGTAWTKLDPGVSNVDLWNVFGFADAVYLGGSNGTILRFKNDAFELLTTPTTDIVFGMWGSSSSDVWAVGGENAGSPFVWRLQGGSTFDVVPGVPAELTTGPVWKVTGRSATDVYMSAQQGLVLHWNGTALSSQTVGQFEESLFSLGCSATRCVTAGGNITNGVLYEDDGQGFMSRVPTPDGPVWRGVTPVGDDFYVVGQFGAALHLVGDQWVSDPTGKSPPAYHAAWANPDGTAFAVGGDFDRVPTIDGLLVYKGVAPLPPLP